jgi:GNAT superfamily N-acetyltransferase
MLQEITIRPAVATDLPELLNMEQGVITAERPFDPTIAPDPVHYYDLRALMAHERAVILVACHGPTIVSSGYALEKPARPYLDHKTYTYFGFMYTLPAYRGKGINGLLIEALKEWSLAHGLQEMRLTVYQDNLPALKAYEKVGFKRHIVEMRWRADGQ